MSDAQALIRDAQDKAERLCALAVEHTPAAYQSFITLIEQRRRSAGRARRPSSRRSVSRTSPSTGG